MTININHIDDESFAKLKILEYAQRYEIPIPLSEWDDWDPRKQLSFLVSVMRYVRHEIHFGAPDYNGLPPLWRMFTGSHKASCGYYCLVLMKLYRAFGYESRFVFMTTEDGRGHVGLELAFGIGWVYLDPLFEFAAVLPHPRSAEELQKDIVFVQKFDEYFNTYHLRFVAEKLADYFYKISYDQP